MAEIVHALAPKMGDGRPLQRPNPMACKPFQPGVIPSLVPALRNLQSNARKVLAYGRAALVKTRDNAMTCVSRRIAAALLPQSLRGQTETPVYAPKEAAENEWIPRTRRHPEA
jgi:hypothetical protein